MGASLWRPNIRTIAAAALLFVACSSGPQSRPDNYDVTPPKVLGCPEEFTGEYDKFTEYIACYNTDPVDEARCKCMEPIALDEE